jgi:hypothetical protein
MLERAVLPRQCWQGATRPAGRRARAVVSAGVFALAAVLAREVPARAAPALESSVKAAYVFKLPPFVEWPGAVTSASSGPFNLCVVGSDALGDLLDRSASDQRLGVQSVAILHLSTSSTAGRCQMMYVAGDPQFVSQILDAVSGTPVLTVTDSGDDGRVKGIVNFVIRDNHVRFEIDRAAAARNHLVISSKLLSIAVSESSTRGAP